MFLLSRKPTSLENSHLNSAKWMKDEHCLTPKCAAFTENTLEISVVSMRSFNDWFSHYWFNPQVGKIPWRRERLPTSVFWPREFHRLYSPWGPKEFSDTTEQLSLTLLDFPGGSAGKESTCNAGDLGSIPGLGRSPGERKGNPLQYSCLGSPMDGGAWWATVQGVSKSWTRLRNQHKGRKELT